MFFAVRNSQSNDSLIKAYIHQHLWLLFTSLSLGLSDIVYNTDNCTHFLDPDYIKRAAALQHKCITIVAHCLETVPQDADGVCVCVCVCVCACKHVCAGLWVGVVHLFVFVYIVCVYIVCVQHSEAIYLRPPGGVEQAQQGEEIQPDRNRRNHK